MASSDDDTVKVVSKPLGWLNCSVGGGGRLRDVQTVELCYLQEIRLAPPCRHQASSAPDLQYVLIRTRSPPFSNVLSGYNIG